MAPDSDPVTRSEMEAAVIEEDIATPAAEYHDGAIWWRGSNASFVFMLPFTAGRLRDTFATDPEPYAQQFARDLTVALNQLAQHNHEDAANVIPQSHAA